jgi:hypothetical protein
MELISGLRTCPSQLKIQYPQTKKEDKVIMDVLVGIRSGTLWKIVQRTLITRREGEKKGPVLTIKPWDDTSSKEET